VAGRGKGGRSVSLARRCGGRRPSATAHAATYATQRDGHSNERDRTSRRRASSEPGRHLEPVCAVERVRCRPGSRPGPGNIHVAADADHSTTATARPLHTAHRQRPTAYESQLAQRHDADTMCGAWARAAAARERPRSRETAAGRAPASIRSLYERRGHQLAKIQVTSLTRHPRLHASPGDTEIRRRADVRRPRRRRQLQRVRVVW
jgi:hypothetical protein